LKPTIAPTVIKIGGTTLEDPKTSPQLWDALAALAKTRPLIVVHGGGKAVDRLLDQLGMPVERRMGLRVTPPEQIDYISGVLAGTINKRIVGFLTKRGVRTVGICLGDGHAVPTSRFRPPDPTMDLGLVGNIDRYPSYGGDDDAPQLLRLLTWAGYCVVVSSIGIELSGTLLNVNADDAAVGAALQVNAETLVLMTDVPGILDQNKQLIPRVDFAGIERLIEQQVISGGMIPKARAAASAATSLNAPVVILSGNDPDSLARWASGHPAGTTVLPRARRSQT
jgi:acetylglutamate kinase